MLDIRAIFQLANRPRDAVFEPYSNRFAIAIATFDLNS